MLSTGCATMFFFVFENILISNGVKMTDLNWTTKIIVNKKLSSQINVRSSVRHGCPLSPLLFAIYLEHYCRYVIQCRGIRGFILNESEVELSSYMDDVAILSPWTLPRGCRILSGANSWTESVSWTVCEEGFSISARETVVIFFLCQSCELGSKWYSAHESIFSVSTASSQCSPGRLNGNEQVQRIFFFHPQRMALDVK